MNLSIRLLPGAKEEFDAAVDWYEGQRVGFGIDFVARVREVLQRISANPQTHAPVYKDVRKAVMKQFPYVVLYRHDEGEILVVSVFHTARDPSIWRSRV